MMRRMIEFGADSCDRARNERLDVTDSEEGFSREELTQWKGELGSAPASRAG
jgi:hypothetical protein